jgi:hypothetical protein
LDLGEDDELVLVDNSRHGALPPDGAGPVRVVRAPDQFSSYYARNIGIAAARCDWVLLIDADTRPMPGLLEHYFATTPPDDCGAIVGGVRGEPDQEGLAARYARQDGILSQDAAMGHRFLPYGATANLLVRRAAWADVGGFCEGIVSAGDVDFSWRLQLSGWKLGTDPGAWILHAHREQTRQVIRQQARYGAGRAWLGRRYPGSQIEPGSAFFVARQTLTVGAHLARGRTDAAAVAATSLLAMAANRAAYLLSNAAKLQRPERSGDVVLFAAEHPSPEADGLIDPTTLLSVEALRRARRPEPWRAREVPTRYLEDEGRARRTAAVARLIMRRPYAVLRDVGRRPRGGPSLSAIAPAALRLLESRAALSASPDERSRAVADRVLRLAGAREAGG